MAGAMPGGSGWTRPLDMAIPVLERLTGEVSLATYYTTKFPYAAAPTLNPLATSYSTVIRMSVPPVAAVPVWRN